MAWQLPQEVLCGGLKAGIFWRQGVEGAMGSAVLLLCTR